MSPDWAAARDEFPTLRKWNYFNAATFGPLPRRAVAAAAAHFERRDETAALDFLDWFACADQVRAKAARLIGARPEDIAFIPSAGVGLSWILHGLEWRRGDQILTLENEFPNNLYAPHLLAQRGVETIEAPSGEAFDPKTFIGAIGPRTRLVLLSALSYSSGLRPPLERIAEAVRASGALLCIDGTQGLGAIPFDVSALEPDLVLAHGYKWLLCPTGAGILYVRPGVRERLRPIVVSWRSNRDWRNVDELHHGAPELPDEAARYEGGVQNFSGVFAMGAVLDLFLELGLENVWARVAANAERTKEVLRAAGGELRTDRRPYFDSPILTARFPGADASALALRLREKRVALAARKGYLRVSPHFYNDETDFEALAAALQQAL